MTLRKRFYAFFTDLIILSFLKKGLILYYFFSLKQIMGNVPLVHDTKGALFVLFNFSIFLTLFTGYFVSFYFLGKGQTPGKYFFNLKIETQIEKKDQSLTLSECVLRTLGYVLCYLSGAILFLIPLFNKKNHGIQDWISGTKVKNLAPELATSKIDETSTAKKDDFFYSENEAFDLHLYDDKAS